MREFTVSSWRFKSHRDIYLAEHLKAVGEEAKQLLLHPALKDSDSLSRIAYVIGISHDFGKFTTFFQEKLSNKPTIRELSNHSTISAIFGAWLIKNNIDVLSDYEFKEYAPLMAYIVISAHHGNLKWPGEIFPEEVSLNHLKRQFEDISRNKNVVINEFSYTGYDISGFFNEKIPCIINELKKQWTKLKYTNSVRKEKLALHVQLLFSALIDADKYHASQTKRPERCHIPPDIVDKYITLNFPSDNHPLHALRRNVYKQVVTKANTVHLPGVFTLTAPTGAGKTLTSLSFALKLRKRLQKKWNVPPRIIYVLPFTNLIEQNFGVFYRVFALMPEFSISPEKYLLRHHYLAEIQYTGSNENIPVEKALLLTESWESEVIVSTFVQLFHTLFGYKNRFLKKLHSLIGSIIILDEAQSLPMEYWKSIGELLDLLHSEMGLSIILMTATRPMILKKSEELVTDNKILKDFSIKHQRTRLKIETIITNQDDIAYLVKDLLPGRQIMIILNTIKQSIDIYNLLKEQLQEFIAPYTFSFEKMPRRVPILYLSTNIIPFQRKERLRFLKRWLKTRRPVILVATQVVEAGVDLDFHNVIREIGPIDSIIQAAGRCNREMKYPQSDVRVTFMDPHSAAMIYGAIHLKVAQDILNSYKEISEASYQDLLEKYFSKTMQFIGEDKLLWDAYKNMRFSSSVTSATLQDFPLIPPQNEISIYVAITENKEKWLTGRFLKDVLLEKDINERRLKYLKYKKNLHDFTIKVYTQRALKNLPPQLHEKSDIRWVPHKQLKDYYNLETGFIWINNETWII